MSSCGSNAGMEMTAPMINVIVNNALLHSNSRINQMQSNHSHPALFSGRLTAPDFVMKCTEVSAVRCPQIWKFIWITYIFRLKAVNDAQNVRADTSHRKDNNQKNQSKMT